MAARIEVMTGPDAGWRYTVVGSEARIGRSAGNQVRLTDPAWPDGALRVQLRQGGYLVTNDLPYTVYLDGKPLPVGAARTLHHGAALQPTGATLLKLGIVDAPAGPMPLDGVHTEAPTPRVGWGSAVRRRLPLLVLMAAIGLHVQDDLAPVRADNAVIAATAKSHKVILGTVREDPKYAKVKNEVELAETLLTQGVFLESGGDPSLACLKYVEARNRLSVVRKALDGTEATAVIDAASDFVRGRIEATSGRELRPRE